MKKYMEERSMQVWATELEIYRAAHNNIHICTLHMDQATNGSRLSTNSSLYHPDMKPFTFQACTISSQCVEIVLYSSRVIGNL